jgi:superfamily II DNA or RNA helicase
VTDTAGNLELRPYQSKSILALREGVRAGNKRQILTAPTGSGKTVCAAHLMQEAANKMSRAAFVCDRVALVDQTSKVFDTYGIAHGVMQADHWRARPWERIQVASAQTLARRGWKNGELQLLVYDECHTLYKSVTDFIAEHPEVIVVGLTATPFSKGLGAIFTNVVNVSTTDQLIAEGYLVPVKAYAGKAADMAGARTKFDGEWAEDEMEKRGLTIIGDVVSEWITKTAQHFDGPVKTIVFSATVAHGEELCRRFQEAGYNFQQVSYKDGNDEKRRALIEEFRQPDSEIMGLVSCEALAKGFDVPDIKCGISARPYRKSLSGHIQQLGRVMRPYPGKQFALWLDHSGNFLRFIADTQEVFADGVARLDRKEYDAKVRKEPTEEEKTAFSCGACKFLMGMASHCPACGWERPRPRSMVREIGGELHAVDMKGDVARLPSWASDRDAVWRQLCHLALEKKRGDQEAAKKFALAQYRNIYLAWPRAEFNVLNIEPPDPRLVSKVKSQLIAWANRRAA